MWCPNSRIGLLGWRLELSKILAVILSTLKQADMLKSPQILHGSYSIVEHRGVRLACLSDHGIVEIGHVEDVGHVIEPAEGVAATFLVHEVDRHETGFRLEVRRPARGRDHLPILELVEMSDERSPGDAG